MAGLLDVDFVIFGAFEVEPTGNASVRETFTCLLDVKYDEVINHGGVPVKHFRTCRARPIFAIGEASLEIRKLLMWEKQTAGELVDV